MCLRRKRSRASSHFVGLHEVLYYPPLHRVPERLHGPRLSKAMSGARNDDYLWSSWSRTSIPHAVFHLVRALSGYD